MRQGVGFTLAEVLIALALLGIVAAFTIPKILQTSQSKQYNSIAKETLASVSEAYISLKVDGVDGNTSLDQILAKMNVLGPDPTCTMDYLPNQIAFPIVGCSMRLKNGATLFYNPGSYFGGTTANNGIPFAVDPDGKPSAIKAIGFVLYFNGKTTTYGKVDYMNTWWRDSTTPLPNNLQGILVPYGASQSNADPSYFSW